MIKLLRKNPDDKNVLSGWQLFACVCSCLLPSDELLPFIFNYFYNLINNHPQEIQKEWARICLKRLYYLSQNKFKKNYAPGSLEIKCTFLRKKLPLHIHLRNGSSTYIFVEPYTTVGDVFKSVLRNFKVDEKDWKFYGLFESVER